MVTKPQQQPVPTYPSVAANTPIAEYAASQLSNPQLPMGAATIAETIPETPQQFIATDSGQVTGTVAAPITTAPTATAAAPTPITTTTMDAVTAAPKVEEALSGVEAAKGAVTQTIPVEQQTESSVSNLQAAQGTAIMMTNPVTREIQDGELITGSTVDATKVAELNAMTQAATAAPSTKATVQGQLEGLLGQFEDGKTPAWAAGAMRNAQAVMAARGLGSSSIAGQAVIQAAMESALPIAQADANTIASFEAQNLSNRQQAAMLAAEQRARFLQIEFDQNFQARVQNAARIADVANMNFTAEQQIALENSRAANSMNLANLSNSQAMVMAEAAALANLDIANLNNRQQVAVQNAQNFLQMDMANLSNEQQTTMFKAQSRIQSLFTDQAAENAARQFNATSENQTKQFFASLSSTVSQFNAAQRNAQSQFNAGEANVINRFNAEIQNQRDQFNAKNRLVIDQSNAVWRRELATADTAAINRANEINALALLEMTNDSYNNMWQLYSDTLEWAFESADNERDRLNAIARQAMVNDASLKMEQVKNDYASSSALGNFFHDVMKEIIFPKG